MVECTAAFFSCDSSALRQKGIMSNSNCCQGQISQNTVSTETINKTHSKACSSTCFKQLVHMPLHFTTLVLRVKFLFLLLGGCQNSGRLVQGIKSSILFVKQYQQTNRKISQVWDECNYNLVSVTHKESYRYLHHKWQWVASITPHRLQTADEVGADDCIIICSKFWAKFNI